MLILITKTDSGVRTDHITSHGWEQSFASMAPGSTQLVSFSWIGKLARYVKAGQHEKMVELSKK
jgi:hypothetical protein